MDGYNCIIVDDSEIDRLSLLALLKSFPQFKVIGTFASANKALPVVEEIEVDVIFLDIQMPGISGIEFRRRVQKIPVCVFISYSPKFAVESFKLETLDYIVKPLTKKRFEQTVKRIQNFMTMYRKSNETDSTKKEFFIKSGTEHIRINEDDILYLEAQKDYTDINTLSGKKMILANLGSALKMDSFESFIRIHRSFAIPKNRIHRITSTKVTLDNGTELPVGRAFRERLNEIL